MFSQTPGRMNIGEANRFPCEFGTLQIYEKAGELTPLEGVVRDPVTGVVLFAAYGINWFVVMGHLQTWYAAWQRGEIDVQN